MIDSHAFVLRFREKVVLFTLSDVDYTENRSQTMKNEKRIAKIEFLPGKQNPK